MADPIVVKPFEWAHWAAMWQLVGAHLDEHGIVLDPEDVVRPIPPQEPEQVVRGKYEWDMEYVGPVYLRGAGGFWLAWYEETPAGHVGAQDLGGVIELRRMYVRAEYRRRRLHPKNLSRALEDSATLTSPLIPWNSCGAFMWATLGVYPLAYYPHNIHFLWASSSMEGRSEVAIEAGEKVAANVRLEMIEEFPSVEFFKTIPMQSLVQFGRWDEVLSMPAPPEDLEYSRGIWHYARAVALARTGEHDAAQAEIDAMQPLMGNESIWFLDGNDYPASQVLPVVNWLRVPSPGPPLAGLPGGRQVEFS